MAASALAGLAPFASAQTDAVRALPIAAAPSPAASSGAAYSATLQPILVVATTPLLGIGLPLSQVAANVQLVHARQLEAQHRETLAGYFLVDFDAAFQATRHLRVFPTLTNVFDRRYASFGTLGRNFFAGPNNTFDGASPVSEHSSDLAHREAPGRGYDTTGISSCREMRRSAAYPGYP
jgi:hypothetical protein